MSTKRSWKLQDFVAHGANVKCLALGHKSGRVLVTGGDDKKVNLWAVGKHNCIMSLSGHVTPVESVRFGHAEDLVCAGSQAGALKIWDLEAAKIFRTLTGHKNGIRCIDFHPYGDFLTSGSVDTSIRLWDIRRRGCIFTYKGHKMAVNSLKFSPDGQWIASAGEEGLVKLWDLRAGRMLKEFVQHGGSVTAVEFHPNEFLLASSSTDHTVNFWDLENFQLVSTTQREANPMRCIYFDPNGKCLFAGTQDVLKVYGWEPPPAVTHDTLHINWGRIQDIATAQNQLIGASCHLTNVVLYVVDLKKVQPFGGDHSTNSTPAFVHGHSLRKSFSREKPLSIPKSRMDVKTIEESDRSTDPEDESLSLADIQNVGDYQAIFQPNRILNRTPPPAPFPAPLDDDPSLPQIIQSPLVEPDVSETQTCSLERGDGVHSSYPVRRASSPQQLEVAEQSTPVPQTSSSPLMKHPVRKLSSCSKDCPQVFPEVDFPVKLSSIRHSPSDSALSKPSVSHARSHSLSRNLMPIDNRNAKTEPLGPPSGHTLNPSHSRAIEKPVSTCRPLAAPKVTNQCTSPIQDCTMILDHEAEMEHDDFIPMSSDKPSGLDLDDFLPRSYSRTFGYQQTFPDMSEAEVLSSMMRGFDSVMAVLNNRQRSLQIVYSLWHNKDLKAAVDSAIAMNDQGVLVDLLGVLTIRSSIWNLDLCATVLPSIQDLLQSKYEMYMKVGCDTLRLILRNFSPVIKTNVQAPIQTVGVDISREERYNKCIRCYQSLLAIRSFLLKRQTMQGKLGQTFRELSILMQSLD